MVKENRKLWHNSADGFTGNTSKRIKLFIEIAEKIGTTACEANRRFTSLRERYGKESKKQEETITWIYYKDLSFLKDVIRRRDKRKKVEASYKDEMETEDSAMETSEYYLESLYEEEEKPTKVSKQKLGQKPEQVRYVTHKITTEKATPQDSINTSICVIDIDQPERDLTQVDDVQDETVETAFKYFKLELKKMDQNKREYCIDKMMMAFVNAKSSYSK